MYFANNITDSTTRKIITRRFVGMIRGLRCNIGVRYANFCSRNLGFVVSSVTLLLARESLIEASARFFSLILSASPLTNFVVAEKVHYGYYSVTFPKVVPYKRARYEYRRDHQK